LQRTVRIDVGDLENFAAEALHRCLQLRKNKRTDLTKRVRFHFVYFRSPHGIIASTISQAIQANRRVDVSTRRNFVSTETARRQARALGNSLARELRLYIVHGLLHLHGLDDRSEADARRMRATQEKILAATS